MKITSVIDLDDIFADIGHGEGKDVSRIIVDELKTFVRSEIKKSLKSDKELQRLLSELKRMAIETAIKKLKDIE